MKKEIRNKIFDILTEISESQSHSGLLVVFSDLNNVLAKGALPIGIRQKNFKDFNETVHIRDENAKRLLKKVGVDGAVLIDDKGFIYSPSVYLNINVLGVDENQIEPEFAARHIAALATSSSTKATVYTLSEETGKVREFIKGKIKRRYPDENQEKVLEIIQKDIQTARIKVE